MNAEQGLAARVDNMAWTVVPRRSRRHKRTRISPEEHLARLIKDSSYCVFVTGAGLSTNSGIRDYRGPNGIWTEAAKHGAKEGDAGVWCESMYASIPAASPTMAHMAIAKLANAGYVKQVISQNEDGLHLRSGLRRALISEIHGNDFIELCRSCKAEVHRTFVTYYHDTYKPSNPLGQHVTGRTCPYCGTGNLLDLCVDFGESPDGKPWGRNNVHRMRRARHAMRRADLVVAWGTSLSVVANYFDPWDPSSRWARCRRRHSPSTGAGEGEGEGAGTSACASVPPSANAKAPCQLAIVNVGRVLDEDIAALKWEVDVDVAATKLLQALGVDAPSPYDIHDDPFLPTAIRPKSGEPAAKWRIADQDGKPGPVASAVAASAVATTARSGDSAADRSSTDTDAGSSSSDSQSGSESDRGSDNGSDNGNLSGSDSGSDIEMIEMLAQKLTEEEQAAIMAGDTPEEQARLLQEAIEAHPEWLNEATTDSATAPDNDIGDDEGTDK